jgi:phosphoglycerol transferase
LYPGMGAPGVVSIANWPDNSNIHYFGIWVLSLFIKEPGLLLNVFFILTFAFISIGATISLRLLGITPMTSILGGVLYSLLDYHFFRGIQHLFLSTYAMVPLACVLILWVIKGEIFIGNFKLAEGELRRNFFSAFNLEAKISIIVAIFIGMDNTYYIFFSCLGISFAIIWNFLEERNLRKALSSLAVLFVVAISTFINIIPYLITVFNGVESGLYGTRSVSDIEPTSLKLSQLVLPVVNHRLNLFSRMREFYETKISTSLLENYSSSLGLFISAGLIASFFIMMARRRGTGKNKPIEANVHYSAVLNAFMIVTGTVGGISSLIAFVAPFIRFYNRVCIFIAFFSLYLISHYLDKILVKLKLRSRSRLIITALLGIVFALDQVPVGGNTDITDKYYFKESDKYSLDKEFIQEIERITPAGSMVFQLPFIRANYFILYYNNMGFLDHFYPFIHSKTLKWSYRASLFSPAEWWQIIVAGSSVVDMLKHLAGIGFAGVYLDKFGYDDDEYAKLRGSIIEITGIEPITSKNGRMEYFYLGGYLENLRKGFNTAELEAYGNWTTVTMTVPFNDLHCYTNAEKIGDKIVIHKDGYQYGPYISLEKGRYNVLVKGNNLSRAITDVCYDLGEKQVSITEISRDDYEIKYTFEIRQSLNKMEFLLFNQLEADVILYSYEIEKIN